MERRNVKSKKVKKNCRKRKYHIAEKRQKGAFNGAIKAWNKKVGKSNTRCEAIFKGTEAVGVDNKGKKLKNQRINS